MSALLQTRFVLYDGGCGMCRRLLRVVRLMDWFHRAVPRDIAMDWPAVQRQFPHLSRQTMLRDMHVIREDGLSYPGFDAYRSLAWVLPLAWPVLPLLYLPPVRRLGWRVYRHVADNRCTSSACSIPSAAEKPPRPET